MLDKYGFMLTQRQRRLFELRYAEDQSLGEIAENEGISRQAVRDALMRAENTFLRAEQALGISAHKKRLQEIAAQFAQGMEKKDDTALLRALHALNEEINNGI